jgi:hypothetical protein
LKTREDICDQIDRMEVEIRTCVKQLAKVIRLLDRLPAEPLATRMECRQFARDKGLPEQAGDWFFDSMEANGWMRGKVRVRKWKSHFASLLAAGYVPENLVAKRTSSMHHV